jgi:OPA family glycerol-3-phosphate transporter-like MFS transporter 1/2
MANWFGKGKRGLVMGIWNAHTSVGNIVGTVMASMLLPPFCGWGWAFIAPGMFMGVAAVLVWLFLVAQPEDVGIAPTYQKVASKVRVTTAQHPISACVLVLLM